MKKVKVLMSTYNGEKFLREQIDSIINQEGVEVKLLIRDDGSSDDTLGVLQEYASLHDNIEIIKGDNLGFAQSFMTLVYRGAEDSSIDYFAFSDQDDVWLNDKLFSAVNLLEAKRDESKFRLYFSSARAVDEYLNPIFDFGKKENYQYSKSTSLVRCYMLGCTMVFSKELAQFLSVYRPVKPIEMHDLWINQTCAFFGEIFYEKEPHILYRQHGDNAAGVSNSMRVRIKRVIKSFNKYSRRHFRELNAKCFFETYKDLLSKEDKKIVSIVANYRHSLKSRWIFLTSKDYSMGVKSSDLVLKFRILFGLA